MEIHIPGESFDGGMWASMFAAADRKDKLKKLIATLLPGETLIVANGNEVARGRDMITLDKQKQSFRESENFTGTFYSYSVEE